MPPGESALFSRNTEFDGATLRVVVTADDGTELSVNTPDHVIRALPGVTPMPGHRATALTFLKIESGDTSVAHVLLSANPDDPMDHIAFGWWAYFPGQTPLLSFEGSERFPFVDGPELDHGIVPELPVDGTATYTGPAGGLYAYETPVDEGEDACLCLLDEYQGAVTLTADFEESDGNVGAFAGSFLGLSETFRHTGVSEPLPEGGE